MQRDAIQTRRTLNDCVHDSTAACAAPVLSLVFGQPQPGRHYLAVEAVRSRARSDTGVLPAAGPSPANGTGCTLSTESSSDDTTGTRLSATLGRPRRRRCDDGGCASGAAASVAVGTGEWAAAGAAAELVAPAASAAAALAATAASTATAFAALAASAAAATASIAPCMPSAGALATRRCRVHAAVEARPRLGSEAGTLAGGCCNETAGCVTGAGIDTLPSVGEAAADTDTLMPDSSSSLARWSCTASMCSCSDAARV